MSIHERINLFSSFYASNRPSNDYKYKSFYDLIAAYGCTFTPIKRPKGVKQGVKRYCYYNSTQVALAGKYAYCEGFYSSDEVGFPVLHAWLTDGQGNAIDPTLPYKSQTNQQYFGVALSLEFVLWHQGISGYSAILESDHAHRYKLLKEGFPANAIQNPSELDTLAQEAIKRRSIYAMSRMDDGNILIRLFKSSTPEAQSPAEALYYLATTLHKVAEKC